MLVDCSNKMPCILILYLILLICFESLTLCYGPDLLLMNFGLYGKCRKCGKCDGYVGNVVLHYNLVLPNYIHTPVRSAK